jgi:hypothetical protein
VLQQAKCFQLLPVALSQGHAVLPHNTLCCTVLCCVVAGSMDSGKSTLVAVLTHGADGRPLLDNGRGSARMAVFRHKHEIESGRTSSISQQVRGAGPSGGWGLARWSQGVRGFDECSLGFMLQCSLVC